MVVIVVIIMYNCFVSLKSLVPYFKAPVLTNGV